VVNQFVVKRIENLQMRCSNHGAGCTAKLAPGKGGRNVNSHLSECGFVPQPCGKCKKSVLKKDMANHENSSCGKLLDADGSVSLKNVLAELRSLQQRVDKVSGDCTQQ
jgi:hypothetical protein